MSVNVRGPRVLLVPFFVLFALLAAFGLTAAASTRADHVAPGPVASGAVSAVGHKPTTVTDGQGAFRFEGLARGTHQLYLDPSTLPANLRPSAAAPQITLWLNPGQTLVSGPIGRGVRISATYDPAGGVISGIVFVDQDRDGHQGPGEAGLSGVTVVDPTIHQYFIPFDDVDLIALLRESNACQGQQGGGNSVGDVVASRISLTASSDDTIFYYDHWEDGYDADPQQPGPTTLVGTLDAGQTRIFEDEVDTTQLQTTFYFDGRDRISVFGEPASVIRAASPSLQDSTIGTRLAGAWEIDEVANWGRAYVVPAGEDWGAGADFEFAGATVTALQDGTQVFLNGAPFDPLEPTIDAGQTVFRNGAGDGLGGGGLDSGHTITATGPIQVHLYGSLCTFPRFWSGNGYTLEPRAQWNADYWSPVPRRTAGTNCLASADTDIFLYNDTGSPFDITIDDGTVNTVSLPPGPSSVVALNGAPLSDIRGVHLYAPGGEPFWGVANVDTGDVIFEWGYSLIPADELSSQVVFGWAPGNDLDTPISQPNPSGNLAFVTAITNTVVFADFDQDGNADMMDCNGDGDFIDTGECAGLDEIDSINGITLLQGQTLEIADPFDADLTGALLYTAGLREKIAVAWGEDSCIAEPGRPYLDMGYTVLPIGVPSISKADTLVVDVDRSGDTSPGDILQYTVVVANNGLGPMSNVVLTDVLPFTHTDFIAYSIDVSVPPPTSTYAYDDGSGLFNHTLQPVGVWNVDPAVQRFRITWPQIDAGEAVSVTFRVQIQLDVPPDVREITNVALIGSDDTPPRSSEDPDDPGDPDTDTPLHHPVLWLNKLPSDPTTVTAGGYLTYTVVVSNVGNGAALSALVLDNLPPWLTLVPDTLDLALPVGQVISTTTPITIVSLFDETYGDDFDDVSHTLTVWPGGNDGTLAWTAPMSEWIEFGDDGNPDTGDVQVVNTAANTLPGSLQLTDGNTVDVESGAMRCADLSDFVEPHLRFQMQGDTSASGTDTFRVVISSTTSALVTTVTEQRNVATYVLEDIDLSAYASQPAVCVSFVTDVPLDPTDFYQVDDVFIYENAPERSEVIDRVDTTTSVSYSTFTNINPVTYTRILSNPTTIAITHTMYVTDPFPFPPQSRLTTTFQVQVGYPLTDGLQMINSASITATNLISTPYPLRDTEPTLVQSNHVLTVTKTDEPDPVYVGRFLTYTLSWEVVGNEPAPGVVVSDVLPLPYVSFVSCAPLPECQGETSPGSGEVTWDLGNRLPPMSQITRDGGTLTLTVRVESRPPGGVFTNTVFIDDATDTPKDWDDEPTRVPQGSFTLSKRRLTTSPITVTERVEFLIAITNTGVISINRLPLEDTYDPVYLGYVDAVPAPDTVSPGSLTWDDLTVYLPGAVLPPGETTEVWVQFEGLTSTQSLTPPVTINTAVSDGAETVTGEVLPREQDDADVGIVDETPTAVQLLYFRAQPKADGVLVQWATLFEADTYGFWLYRSDDANLGHAVPVAFVAARGWGVFGATYQYLDGDLPAGLYHYWLVEVENSGRRATYGPTSAWSGAGVADLPFRIYLPLIRQP